MLDTKPVKYLQSRPHHVKVFIFSLTMVAAGIISLSFLVTSLRNTFTVANMKESNKENKVAEEVGMNRVNSPSLFKNLKANIYDVGDSMGSILGGVFENGALTESSTTKNIESERSKKIKPMLLPIDQQ